VLVQRQQSVPVTHSRANYYVLQTTSSKEEKEEEKEITATGERK
jgi:hypothetical protein